MKAFLYVVIGALIGAAIVRGFMLDMLEEMGWRMFWQAVREQGIGNISPDGLRTALTSATSIKVTLGAVGGAAVGAWLVDRSDNEEVDE